MTTDWWSLIKSSAFRSSCCDPLSTSAACCVLTSSPAGTSVIDLSSAVLETIVKATHSECRVEHRSNKKHEKDIDQNKWVDQNVDWSCLLTSFPANAGRSLNSVVKKATPTRKSLQRSWSRKKPLSPTSPRRCHLSAFISPNIKSNHRISSSWGASFWAGQTF